MNQYYILEETFKKEKAYLLLPNFKKDLLNKISAGKPLSEIQQKDIELFIKGKDLKDFMGSAKIIVVSNKFLNVLNSLSVSNYHAYPIKLSNTSKTRNYNDYFLFIPEVVSFFDYKNSDYEGMEKERYIGQINKMVVDSSKLEGRRICRFYELITDILIDETLKSAFEKENVKGLNYIPASEFKFPYF
ncbi:MAG: hypothetical protein EHM93_07500 [Bacteroidales bacterium]|nr:MAG: hypothetical protein EHM93_07500 [Bacteroidales bacterium]